MRITVTPAAKVPVRIKGTSVCPHLEQRLAHVLGAIQAQTEGVAVVVQTLANNLPPSSYSLSVLIALQVWGPPP